MKIATFNINGIKARLPRLLEWLEEFSPDVACLQEIKSIDENFPRLEIEALGYQVETHGQKAFNGVAILSKHPMSDITRGLPSMTVGDVKNGEHTPEQARYMEATIKGVRIATIYLPNGNPLEVDGVQGPKFDYKLAWMDKLVDHAKYLLTTEQPIVLAGDYNIIPKEIDPKELDRLKKSKTFEDKLFLQKLLIKGTIPFDDDLVLTLLGDDDKTIKTAAINLASKSKSNQLIS